MKKILDINIQNNFINSNYVNLGMAIRKTVKQNNKCTRSLLQKNKRKISKLNAILMFSNLKRFVRSVAVV